MGCAGWSFFWDLPLASPLGPAVLESTCICCVLSSLINSLSSFSLYRRSKYAGHIAAATVLFLFDWVRIQTNFTCTYLGKAEVKMKKVLTTPFLLQVNTLQGLIAADTFPGDHSAIQEVGKVYVFSPVPKNSGLSSRPHPTKTPFLFIYRSSKPQLLLFTLIFPPVVVNNSIWGKDTRENR